MTDFIPSVRLAFRKRNAFSLVELLTVMAVIGILTTVSMTGIASLISSNHVNEATSIVQGQLELARQTAKTLNRSVQLRFYQNNAAATSSIGSMQIVVPAEPSTTETDQPVEKPTLLPQSVIIADSTNDLSLTAFPYNSGYFNPALPANFSCYILTFSPTGTITATDNTGKPVSPTPSGTVYWKLSIVPQTQYRAKGSVGMLQNYATFYLNSVNGTYSCARP
jgi:uncharacterized protein (TIGR02596 family)